MTDNLFLLNVVKSMIPNSYIYIYIIKRSQFLKGSQYFMKLIPNSQLIFLFVKSWVVFEECEWEDWELGIDVILWGCYYVWCVMKWWDYIICAPEHITVKSLFVAS